MHRDLITHYSNCLNREMHILVHGTTGVPFIVFPCQDGMCDNWESFQMQDTLADFIENGNIQLFAVDTVDKESWSDEHGDPGHRAWVQEQYYQYIVNEAYPLVRKYNDTDNLPIPVGFSLGATHAAICFLRRPDLFGGMLALSGCYDTNFFWHGWMDGTLYQNDPVAFIANMPADHPYVNLYNQRKAVFCVGTGAWEDEGIRTTGMLSNSFRQKGINIWCDFWGSDVNHDWPWWRKQIRYFMPYLLGWN